MKQSRVLQKLRSGGVVTVAAITRVAEPWLTEVIGQIGYDVAWFELEHRPFEVSKIDPISLACRATGIDLMVRVRKGSYESPMRALEFGSNGIMVPHCESAAEARKWVEWVKFPPQGKRGLDGSGADADFGLADVHEYLAHANKETFLVLQIEDKEAVEQVEEIAAVAGFDLLFIGPGDLSLSYGVPLQFNHPLMRAAYERVAAAAARAGKWWGTTTPTPESAEEVIKLGGRMIIPGVDHSILLRGFRDSYAEYQKVVVNHTAKR